MQISSELWQAALTMPFVPHGQKYVLAGARFQAHAFEAMMRYQIEVLTFLKHRSDEDVKFVNDLVASDEFNDAFDVFTTFMQNAATSYTTEASTVASIGSKLATESAKRFRKEAQTAAEDISVAATA